MRVLAGCFAIQQGEDLLAGWLRHHFFIDMAHFGIRQDLWLELPLSRGNNANAVVTIHVHKTQGAEAVEPDIGHPLDNLPFALVGYRLFQLFNRLWSFSPGGTLVGEYQFEFGCNLLEQAAAAIARAEVVDFLGNRDITAGGTPDNPSYEGFVGFGLNLDLAPLAWGMALIVVAGAFELGQRLQRDTEGLV